MKTCPSMTILRAMIRGIYHNACMNGQLETAEIFMQKSVELGIDLNAKNAYGLTAFHIACTHGHIKIVEILMQKSTELNIMINATDHGPKYSHGWTGFHRACAFGNSNVVELQNISILT